MEKSDKQEQRKNKFFNIKTFNVPLDLGEIKENTIITTNTSSNPSEEQIFDQAFKFQSQGKILEAAKCYQYLISQGIQDSRVFSNYAILLISFENFKEAERYFRKAIELNPDFVDAYFNLGNLLKDLNRIKEAEVFTRKAIQINPNSAVYHYNLANILKELDDFDKAQDSYERAIRLNPMYADSYYSLGLTLLAKNEHDKALKYFSKCFDLLRGSQKLDFDTLERFKKISKAKIDHDIQQFDYLSSLSIENRRFSELANLYRKISLEINWPSETEIIVLNERHQKLLYDNYNLSLNKVELSKLTKPALSNSIDVDKITMSYLNHESGVTYVDDLLSTEALDLLLKFLLESTIWFGIKPNGYLGAYLREGLANPLIIQIAEELRKKFPKIFKDHLLEQLWAFKYDSRAKNKESNIRGIKIHADQAAINVNFWITKNEANLNPTNGGLIVYHLEAPKEWDFKKFNGNDMAIQKELKATNYKSTVIPYKANRAVIFNSNLFHETDTYEFKEGYENRRINVTMLFGKRINA
ncbi:tetratricopeptide repeat protein [Prochlorococcus sp. MIT 0801]|uniref:tetratricopeptide repeat protein n=1 Tax=Prochlorococcus sp. MIT 0801 TaxID=1501269 RepID=UPI0004F592C8|nr:tetratricopeptide repeat protein [Prochlorococcus sp. MIT 0801]AIQ97964.1 Translation elongation factor P [Prochlorococcus sp. MIT 0801]